MPDVALCDKPSATEASVRERTLERSATKASVRDRTLERRQGLNMRVRAKATAEFEVVAGGVPEANPMKGQARPGTTVHQEAKRAQQRVEDPHHWLKVPANNLKEIEVVAKRRSLAKELSGQKANGPVRIGGIMRPWMMIARMEPLERDPGKPHHRGVPPATAKVNNTHAGPVKQRG